MFWALCADTHRGGVQPLCSSAPEPGVESLPLPEQLLSWCIFFRFRPHHRLRGPPPPLAQGRLKWRDIRFPRRCGGAVNVDQSHFAIAHALGTFSHTTCYPIGCVRWTCLSDRSVSDARSEPKGALLFSLLPFQCLDDLREGGAIAAEDVFNEAAFGAVFAERRHRDRELQRVVNLHIEERLVKRTGRIRCRF